MTTHVIMNVDRPNGSGGTYKAGVEYDLPDDLAALWRGQGVCRLTSVRSEQTGAVISATGGNFPDAPAQNKRIPVEAVLGREVNRLSVEGTEFRVLTTLAAPPEHFADDQVVVTSSSVVKCSGGSLDAISCTVGTAITLTIYDSPKDATGRVIYTGSLSAGDVVYPSKKKMGQPTDVTACAVNGMYASFTGTATFEIETSEKI